MLQMFYLDIAYVLQKFSKCFMCFLQVFQTYVSNISSVFRRILQMFHQDVSKVDRVLHMLQWCRWLSDSGLLQGFGSYLMPSSCGAPHPLLSLPSLHLAMVVRARRETLPDEHANARGGGAQVGRRWYDACVVAPEQAEVRVVRSLRAGNKQPWTSIWTSGC
jgi:hypothetical protein